MPLSTSQLAYAVEYDLLDRALADPKGIRYFVGTWDAGRSYRFRLYQARVLDRQKSREVLEPGDPSYGVSAYDCIVLRLKQDTKDAWWLYFEKSELNSSMVESLSE